MEHPDRARQDAETQAVASPRTARRRLRACHACDLVIALPPLRPSERAHCPRCGQLLVRRNRLPAQRGLALATASLACLALAVSFPFAGFQIHSVGNRIGLADIARALIGFDEPLIAAIVLLTVVILPGVYLVGIIWLHVSVLRSELLPHALSIARSIGQVTPWLMADVFIIGALVSLIKVSGLAEISLDPAFWFFCAFAFLLLKTRESLDADWLWFALAGEPRAPAGTRTAEAAGVQGLAGCSVCGLINRLDRDALTTCRRCGKHLHARHPQSLQRTAALLLSAAILYVPANAYPIMTTTTFGDSTPSTIIGGVLTFVSHGDLPIALIIFTASVLVPLGKVLALGWLCLRVRQRAPRERLAGERLYRIIEFIGRWSMLDVFVVAILVALIRAGSLMSVTPGPAALAFAGVVVLSMLAAMTFDPRLIWEPVPDRPEGSADE